MKIYSFIILSILLFFAGCSGGSGGGDGGSSKGNAKTGVRVLHTSMDTPPVSVSTTAKVGETISTTRFAEDNGFFSLPEGEQTLSVQTVDGGTGPFKFSVAVENRDRHQILLYGTREITGVRASLLELKKLEIPTGFAAVRVAHGVSGAATIQGSVGVNELPAEVNFGSASKHLFVTAGDTLVKLVRSADGKVLVNQQVRVEDGRAYTFIVSGELDYLVIGSLLEE